MRNDLFVILDLPTAFALFWHYALTYSQENWDIDVANHYIPYAGVTGEYFVFN